MAALLPMELEKRQALLEMRSQHARREFVLRWIEKFLPKLIAQHRLQGRAGGNGQTLN
jgi:Lon protease-like protein